MYPHMKKNGILWDHNKSQESLDNNGIKHILARIDHLQINDKSERLNGLLLQLQEKDMSLSIDGRPVVTTAIAYEEKGDKLNIKEQ